MAETPQTYVLRVIDFETTGFKSEDDKHCVVEAAYIDLDPADQKIKGEYQALVRPTCQMSPIAQAVHHISYEEADTNGLPWDNVSSAVYQSTADRVIFVAHNASFERDFFDPVNALWIDTYKVALKLYPDAPKHTNQALKYILGIVDREEHHPPHRALPDCRVTALILLEMMQKITVREMVEITKQPPYLTFMPFGKHRGERMDDLPPDYVQWLSRQDGIDEGVKAAIARLR